MKFSRRFVVFALLAVTGSSFPAAAKSEISIHVIKGRGCVCCTAWVDILKTEGFLVTEEAVHPADLIQKKSVLGVPMDLVSCHTAQIGRYVIEGHVPPADIRRFIKEEQDALGLAVAGMPYGSPGMGPEDKREAYDVFLFSSDGTKEIFSSYHAAR